MNESRKSSYTQQMEWYQYRLLPVLWTESPSGTWWLGFRSINWQWPKSITLRLQRFQRSRALTRITTTPKHYKSRQVHCNVMPASEQTKLNLYPPLLEFWFPKFTCTENLRHWSRVSFLVVCFTTIVHCQQSCFISAKNREICPIMVSSKFSPVRPQSICQEVSKVTGEQKFLFLYFFPAYRFQWTCTAITTTHWLGMRWGLCEEQCLCYHGYNEHAPGGWPGWGEDCVRSNTRPRTIIFEICFEPRTQGLLMISSGQFFFQYRLFWCSKLVHHLSIGSLL